MGRVDDTYPFDSRLSFVPLIEYWRKVAGDSQSFLLSCAADLLERVEAVPELMEPINHPSVLEKYSELIEALTEPLLPLALLDTTSAAVIPPYRLEPVYMTPEFERMGLMQSLQAEMRVEENGMMARWRAMNVYQRILSDRFGIEGDDVLSVIVSANDDRTGLDRCFRVDFDARFCRTVYKGGELERSEEMLRRMKLERMNLDVLTKLLPPEHFSFEGLMLLNVVDVTDQEMRSALKRDLLQPDAMSTTGKLDRLQQRLRALMMRKDLRLGLIVVERDAEDQRNEMRPIARSLLLKGNTAIEEDELDRSIYGRAFRSKEAVIVGDIDAIKRTKVDEILLQEGIRNMVVAPLMYGRKVIGVLEIGSPNPGDIHWLNAMKLDEVISLFATAMKRLMDERENLIQAVIKQHYTAIHPSVEWRFRRAARNFLERRNKYGFARLEQIIFKDVYPLYGLSDIRDSSVERSRSIEVDLLRQLSLAHEVIVEALHVQPLPVLDEVSFRITQMMGEIEDGLNSGDETRSLQFLERDIEPLFPQLETFSPRVMEKIVAYRAALDPKLGIVYQLRRDYEESVAQINDTISNYIDRQEERAQGMFPHYFEKYKTDGVDHNIYVGASLQEDGKFSRLYLQNMRLWQLMLTCGVAWELEKIKGELKVPLDVAHLILAQDLPISIRFRIDEKQFDVDGAYNIRYEIVKKRIDKAVLRGTEERLTQPGMIAIVYTQDSEAEEYRRYINYLRSIGYVTGEIEELEVEDLQGVHGLKALRVGINAEPPVSREELLIEQVSAVMKEIPNGSVPVSNSKPANGNGTTNGGSRIKDGSQKERDLSEHPPENGKSAEPARKKEKEKKENK